MVWFKESQGDSNSPPDISLMLFEALPLTSEEILTGISVWNCCSNPWNFLACVGISKRAFFEKRYVLLETYVSIKIVP